MAVRTPGAGLPARPRLLAPSLVVVALVLLLGGVGIALYTDLLWFRDVGFSEVFSTVLRTKLLLFVAFGLLMALLVGANITLAYRLRPPFRPMSLEQQNLERYRVAVEPYLTPVLLLASGVFGVFAGLSAASRWQTWLLWRNATDFGVKDAQFGRDISYFAFTYPFQRFVLTFVLTAVVLSLLAAAVTHYLFGGVRLQTVGEKVSPAARAHLSVLIGIIVLLKAGAYYLDRFGLAFSERGRVQGASYTDVNAVLPAKNILIGVAIICALLFFANIYVRNIVLPAGALALLVLSAIVLGGVYPAYTQQFRVKPNEIEREAEFIQRNIEATRAAYSIDESETTTFNVAETATQTNLQTLAADKATVPNTRLLDPNVLPPTFTQFQRFRGYFGFNETSLDIDRYDLGDGVKDYVVAVRELRKAGLGADQRNWINEHLIYTHGNGFVAAPANQTDGDGQPVFEVGGLPVKGPLKIDEPRIYFGEGTTDYSVVDTEQAETDGVTEGEAPNYNYDGDGGVELSGPVRKLAYALKFREKNLVLSGALGSESKLQYIRTPRERVQKVAPFLQLDEDPYPAVVDGKILWIVDGYTTSDGYPYSERTLLGEATADSQTRAGLPLDTVNYIRNSVKATVDAYTGEVKLYTFDSDDPVLKTWSKAFPGVLEPESAISDDLRAHFRYPEDLFKVQRELLTRYHVTESRKFFQGDDYWQIPADPANVTTTSSGTNAASANPNSIFRAAGEGDQPPYYVLSQFPGTTRPSFNLTTSFIARSQPNLTALVSVSSDPGDDYGKIRILQVPVVPPVRGPGQVAGNFQSDSAVRGVLFPLVQAGSSRIIVGNLLTLPVGGSLFYVQPIYVQSQQGASYPRLQYVIVNYGNRTVIKETLAEAVKALLAGSGATPTTPTPGQPPAPGSGPAAQAIADAQQAFDDAQAALAKSPPDFTAYGEAQARLRDALARAAAAGSASPSPSASGSASASPSASPSPSPS
ncbi:MAG: UPF0182 family protein [Mycobacteriales bacterium]|nr:UPF0182 family protein [Mycobacteriales bacterium]